MPYVDVRTKRTLYGIQYMRASAALAVLVFHAFEAMTPALGFLSLGVDLFFVISGFAMVAVTDRSTRPWPFLKARIVRIVPLYWCLTAASSVLVFGGVSRSSPIPFRYLLHRPDLVPRYQLVSSFFFIPADNPAAGYPMPILPTGWTLNFEMYFYSLFALTLLLPRRWQLLTLSATFATLIALGFALSPRAVPWSAWTSPIIFEFLAGAWIGLAWQRGNSLWPVAITMALFGIGLCGLFYAKMYSNLDVRIPHSGIRVISVSIFALLLALVLQAERKGAGIRRYRLPKLLGDGSYSIYLWQFMPVVMLAWIFPRGSGAYAISVIAAGLLGGLLIYRFLERPLTTMVRRLTF